MGSKELNELDLNRVAAAAQTQATIADLRDEVKRLERKLDCSNENIIRLARIVEHLARELAFYKQALACCRAEVQARLKEGAV